MVLCKWMEAGEPQVPGELGKELIWMGLGSLPWTMEGKAFWAEGFALVKHGYLKVIKHQLQTEGGKVLRNYTGKELKH